MDTQTTTNTGGATDHLSPAAEALLAAPDLFMSLKHTRIARVVIEGQPVFFTIANRRDRIQGHQMRGSFYEPRELQIIARYFPKGGVFCDAGANVGNHSLYALKYLNAASAIAFEPNPAAYELLLSNMVLNGVLDRIDPTTLGYGLTDSANAPAMALATRDKNLGATQLVSVAEVGSIQVRRGDDLLAGRHIDFLKVDVEGMELEVLRGLQGTITTCHPPIFVEVDHSNNAALLAWAAEIGYGVAVEGRSFKKNRNILLAPRPQT
ncbi:MAG: FkbM family methyltransferase [bacterium]